MTSLVTFVVTFSIDIDIYLFSMLLVSDLSLCTPKDEDVLF